MLNKGKKISQSKSPDLAGVALPDFVLESRGPSLGKSLIENDRVPTENEIVALRTRIAEAFEAASLYLAEFPDEQEKATSYLEISRRKLIAVRGGNSIANFLKAEENLNRALVVIHRSQNSKTTIKQMIYIVIISSIAYLIITGFLEYLSRSRNDFDLLGVPGSVLSWSCLGGVTATLFYHRSIMGKKWPYDLRWFWIIIRPLLGMIMGAFMYLGIISGLLFFGASSINGTPQEQILLVLAFVGGFSDRLWELLIKSVLGPYSEGNKTERSRGAGSHAEV